MRRASIMVVCLATSLLAGCAMSRLHVAWAITATYNSQPAVPTSQAPAAQAAASAPAPVASAAAGK